MSSYLIYLKSCVDDVTPKTTNLTQQTTGVHKYIAFNELVAPYAQHSCNVQSSTTQGNVSMQAVLPVFARGLHEFSFVELA